MAKAQDDHDPGKQRWFLPRWLSFVRTHPVVAVVAAVCVGAVGSVPATQAVDSYFSSEEFCAHTCHVMRSTVYEEFQKSPHWKTPTGVRPTCSDCHVSGRVSHVMWGHLLGLGELFVHLTTDFSDPKAFEQFRARLAEKVRMRMLENDSYTCRQCHVMELIRPDRKRGQHQHENAKKDGTSCIVCHYNLVHKKVKPSPTFLKASDRVGC